LWDPPHYEEGDDGQLRSHENLPEMRGGAFVRLRGRTMEQKEQENGSKSRERHGQREERARTFQHRPRVHLCTSDLGRLTLAHLGVVLTFTGPKAVGKGIVIG
jgi:hypothetical protein